MTARAQSQCGACERYRSPLSPSNVTGLRKPFCAAFPDGIPDEIWGNKLDHRKPIQGDHDLQWLSNDGAPFPTYAFPPVVLENDGMNEPLVMVAAGDVAISGAMIALVPTAADAARLSVEDGEAVEQLHLTLLFLGDDASTIDEPTRGELRAWAQAMASNWSSVEGRAFAPALFNPDEEDSCAVLVCSGEDLAEFHDTALADASEIIDLPDQHQPFIPHITVLYGQTIELFEMLPFMTIGPVVFDRLRLAFADEVFDVPFGNFDESPQPVDEPVEIVATVVAATLPEREAWDGCPRGFHPAHVGACPPAL